MNAASVIADQVESRQSDAVVNSTFSRPDSAFASRRLLPLVFACILTLLLALAWPILLGHVYTANDLGDFHLPLRSFYAQQLSRGEPFDWCPSLYCGFYLTGEGQVGAYHPLHWLLYRNLPLSLAFDLECWLSYPFMLVGIVMLLRRWKCNLESSLFGALVFTFSGFNLLHFVHPNAIAIIAHVPWLLWSADIILRSEHANNRRLAVVAIALLTASQILLGYPQFVLYSLAIEIGYIVAFTWIDSRSLKAAIAPILRWLFAIACGTLIGALQLLPTIDAFEHSIRQTSGADSNAVSLGTSLQPLNLTQLIAPYLFIKRAVGQNTLELSLYAGIIPFTLAVWWLTCVQKTNSHCRTLSTIASIAAIGALLWSFGQWGPFGWLQEHVPGLNSFRLPCRAIFIFDLAIAIWAALGLTALLNQNATNHNQSESSASSSTPRRHLWWLLAVDIAISASAVFLWPNYISPWPLILFGPILLAIAIWLINRAAIGSRWAINLLVMLAAIDLGVYGLTSSILDGAQPLAKFIHRLDVPPGPPTYRVAIDLLGGTETAPGQKQLRTGDRILLAGFARADGYAGLEPARHLDYRDPAALRAAGVSWIASDAASQIESAAHRNWLAKTDPTRIVPQPPAIAPGKNTLWLRLGHPQPRAWLVTKAVSSDQPAADLAKISLVSAALVKINPPTVLSDSSTPGSVYILSDRPGNFLADVDCPATQLLVVNESYHSGWRASCDGTAHQSPVLRADGDFLGVVIPAGRHRISIKFQPESLRFGGLLSAFGLGLMVVTLLLPTATVRLKRRLHPQT